jgi:hypothetical protein
MARAPFKDMSNHANAEKTSVALTGCCPPFDPARWDEREVFWHKKPFVRDHVTSVFHVPLNMGRKVTEGMARIHAAHAEAPQPLMLSYERSPWGADIFIEVTGEVPGATMDQLTGTFLTKVFEGNFREAGLWAQQMEDYVAAKGRTLEKLYFGYTTCPRCAKAYGKNYVVLVAKVKEPAASKPVS